MTPIFIILAVLLIIGALSTILLRNAVHAALALVGTLLTLAMIYITLEAQFLAAVQVIVYAGAIMVLFLFVIMLLNAAKPEEKRDPLPWIRPIAIIGGLVLAIGLSIAAFSFKSPMSIDTAEKMLEGGKPGSIGQVLFKDFLLPFEAVSILLLVAIIGAVALVGQKEKQK